MRHHAPRAGFCNHEEVAGDFKGYEVFFASPGGLEEERLAFQNIIDEYNHSEAHPRGVSFVPVAWEDTLEDTLPGVGRPQAKINESIRACDYFVLMFWDRGGTSPAGRSIRREPKRSTI
jgi:hypothetical protein